MSRRAHNTTACELAARKMASSNLGLTEIKNAFVGNIWSVFNPWSAMFAWTETLARRWRKSPSLQCRYPVWLGAWPACALFLLFAWLELVAPARDVPRNVAAGLAAYSVVTFTGFAVFGREV
jgi:hypothetical protein